MSLEQGQKLGPYEIEASAGAGGMGEVYKAKDTRLDRTVAIKVLPKSTSINADLRARFEREAKAISSLNHPNICILYDIGHEEGIDFLVLEYLEGETLSERIKRSPLDLKEALKISSQIADALDNAHRQGLVHRDLKPANVILTKEGAKLLDFGLAKLQISGGIVDGISGITQTTPLTGTGTIIGTIQYMAPEQLEGKEADARSDIFAFGAVMYQMITGQRPFDGQSQASLIAAIIERTPPNVSSVMPMIPPGIDRLVKKCLAKDPDDRWQSARDLADELRWISQSGSQAGIPVPLSARRRFRMRLSWTVAAVAILIAGFYSFMWYTQPEPIENVINFGVTMGAEIRSLSWPQLSPDGKHIAFKATDTAGNTKVWIRSMNSRQARPLAGTEGALRPFWSPDSRYLAYTQGRNQLKKIPINGGPPQLIGEFDRAADGTWGTKGIILFDGNATDSISQISASGGMATPATAIDRESGEVFHAWPEFLPDGDHFLYLSSTDSSFSENKYLLCIGSLNSNEIIRLFKVSSKVEYCSQGFILYVRDKILLAQAFDADKLEITGEPIPVAEDVARMAASAVSYFSVSNEGTLVYMNSNASANNELIWVDRSGEFLSRIGEPGKYGDIALSPDGNRLLYAVENPQTETKDFWMYDLRRDVTSRFTFEDGIEFGATWSSDGSKIYYNNGSFPTIKKYVKSSNGIGESELILDSIKYLSILCDISNDGKTGSLITAAVNNPDIEMVDLTTNDPPYPIVKTPQDEFVGRFSPDDKYLAYIVQESNRSDLYVRRLDETGGKWQISNSDVRGYVWGPDGNEILYINSDWEMISVPLSYTGGFYIGSPKTLFTNRISLDDEIGLRRIDITPDGKRFLLVSALDDEKIPEFNVVLNWHKKLEEY